MRPGRDEYAPHFERYVALAPEDVVGALAGQLDETIALFETADGDFRYAPGKWTVRQVLGHIIDTERIFAYRALRIARGDQTPLAGFEQDDYVRYAPACSMGRLIEEFRAVRQATVLLFRNMDEAAWLRRGVAGGNPVSVRALAFVLAGHELHHRRQLQEKYLATGA